ncbi:MAG: Na(+)-translocating NADH-quinone reductase subunit A [Acidobacteriota bacterium]
MASHKIKKGLHLPIAGEPEQIIDAARTPERVALIADDYVGLKPTMHVQAGDDVRRGQLVMEDKKNPGVRITAPAAGRVVGVHRGARRALQSVVIELADDERVGTGGTVRFSSDTGKHPNALDRAGVRDLLVESGLWTALRQRPFSKVPSPEDGAPAGIFVTAIDTAPLAPDPQVVLAGREDDFQRGLVALSKLTDGPVFVCTAPDANIPVPLGEPFRHEVFAGPHPAGTVGVHIHTLMPVSRKRTVWHIGYQDVIAIGRLFDRGELDVTRVVSLAGPPVLRPRLVRTRIGASTASIVRRETEEGLDVRVISGSVLAGRTAQGEAHGYLGRYDNQVSVLREGRERELLGWLAPGIDKYSTINAFVSRLIPGRRYAMSTSTNGSDRAIVPIGMYERVFPMDILPTHMLRALAVHDVEQAEELGVLELDEEDLALCTFVDPGKHDFGMHLRTVLTTIQKEG